MRWGLTKEERIIKDNAGLIRLARGVKRFAWYPTRLVDGTYIWLEYVYRYYHIRHFVGDPRLYCCTWDDNGYFKRYRSYLSHNTDNMYASSQEAIDYIFGRDS